MNSARQVRDELYALDQRQRTLHLVQWQLHRYGSALVAAGSRDRANRSAL